MNNTPRLSRKSPKPKAGIVHLGPGAFFKAFSAAFTQEVLDKEGGDWGIVAVSLRSPNARDQLSPQGCSYTSISLGADGASTRIIEAITDVLVAPEDGEAVLEAMSGADTKIVSLTITEKGYCYEPSTGKLKLDHPDIQHDIANPTSPRSAPGYIVEALARRRRNGARPFTVLSCDNIPSNGKLSQDIVVSLAEKIDPNLAKWIASEVRFPSTMVDRITPATTDKDIESLAQSEGYIDLACVSHEPFKQWVIEDRFVDDCRPNWEIGGAQFVDDVEDHELMKLRCLNGTHSSLAYLGYLAGYQTISETVSDPIFASFVQKLWRDEIVPTIAPPEGEDLKEYCAALLARYQNPSIQHRTWQIAMDGSQKLPQRILGTISDNLLAGRPITGLSHAVAAWMKYVGGIDERGDPIDVRDPLADVLKEKFDSSGSDHEIVERLLSEDAVFPKGLASNEEFQRNVLSAFSSLSEIGTLLSLSRVVDN